MGNARSYVFIVANILGALALAAAAIHQRDAATLACLGVLGMLTATCTFWRETHVTWRLLAAEREARERAAQFHSVADGAAAGLFLADLDGRILVANGALQSMLGYSEDELRHLTPGEFVLDSDYLEQMSRVRALVNGRGEVETLDVRLICRDGRILWVAETLKLVRDEQGRMRYVAGVVQDITEQRRGARVEEIEHLFRLTFDSAPIAVAHVDGEGRLMFVNRRFCALLGYSRDELFGRPLTGLVHPEDAPGASLAMRQVLKDVTPDYRGPVRLLRRDRQPVPGTLLLALTRHPGGEFKHLIVMVDTEVAAYLPAGAAGG